MKRKFNHLAAAILALSAFVQTVPSFANTSDITVYSETEQSETTKTWSLKDIANSINYVEADFQSGASYSYDGLTITGASSSDTISENGISFGKNSGSITYTPTTDGVLNVTAEVLAGAQVCVYRKFGSGEGYVINSPETDGVYTGTAELTAGTTYYIYNRSSKQIFIQEITFTDTSAVVTPEPTPLPEGTTGWSLKGITDEINYVEADFQAGVAYDYKGLTITGAGTGDSISENGVSLAKNSGSITYTPTTDGVLNVTAEVLAGAQVCVYRKFGSDEGYVINSPETDGVYTGTAELTAGTTYYIYNRSSKKVLIQDITFTAGTTTATPSPEPTPLPEGTTGWSLKGIADEINYVESDFQAGAAYDYNGLTITGAGTGDSISENGVSLAKNSGSITYTPTTDGVLNVTAEVLAGAQVCVYRKFGSDEGYVINSPETDGVYTGTAELTAGTTYYIYNRSSKKVLIQDITFTAGTTTATPSPEPTPLPEGMTGWSLKGITDEINYVEADFQAGAAYDYNGLIITGAGTGDSISENGVSLAKNSGSITYTPTTDGVLNVTAEVLAGAQVCVYRKFGSDEGYVINSPETDGVYTGTAELTAGTTYYIYNRSSKKVLIQDITFTEASSGGDITTEFKYENGQVSIPADGILIVASYTENGALSAVTPHIVTTGEQVDITVNVGDKLMLWTNLANNIKPVADAIIITEN